MLEIVEDKLSGDVNDRFIVSVDSEEDLSSVEISAPIGVLIRDVRMLSPSNKSSYPEPEERSVERWKSMKNN